MFHLRNSSDNLIIPRFILLTVRVDSMDLRRTASLLEYSSSVVVIVAVVAGTKC